MTDQALRALIDQWRTKAKMTTTFGHESLVIGHCADELEAALAAGLDAALAPSDQLAAISGALMDAGTVRVKDHDYAAAIRELTAQRDAALAHPPQVEEQKEGKR